MPTSTAVAKILTEWGGDFVTFFGDAMATTSLK